MHEGEHRFIRELTIEIGAHEQNKTIVKDYQLHIYELLKEEEVPPEQIYEYLVQHLGTPREIAKAWKQEIETTPKKTQWLFVVANIVIFLGGTFFTISYHVFHWTWLERLWIFITDATFLLLFIYMLFWGLLGYEIGKEFGHRGYRLLKKTFLISIIPNILFAYLLVFKILPYTWFDSISKSSFFIACMIVTFILYPVSYVGYRWGRKVSI